MSALAAFVLRLAATAIRVHAARQDAVAREQRQARADLIAAAIVYEAP